MEFLASLHPLVVHFPIVCYILFFFFELAGVILKKDFLTKTALILLVTAILFSLLAVLSGNQAHTLFSNSGEDASVFNHQIEVHQQYATYTLFYFAALLFLRIFLIVKKFFFGIRLWLFLLLALIGCFLIYLTSHFGGELVYRFGIGTDLINRMK
jgi:uncharacterized membrane protein